jgi:diguanylate cyclase (GGDEF)-like protein
MELENRLSDVLGEFARTLVTSFPIQAILDHLVVRIVDVLPVTGAGVTLISPGTAPRYVAASDDSALHFEQLQTELGEGPCMLAYETGVSVSVPDLRDEPRFGAFTSRAMAEGLRAVFTFPLRHDGVQLGALDLYRTTAGRLDDDGMAAAQTLADVVSAYLLNAQAREDLLAMADRHRQDALYDVLTGLPNRRLLNRSLDHAISRSRRSQKITAVLFIDLDGFKSVNDTHGHTVGDELLVAVAGRLSGLVRSEDTLCRFGGDEFVILCEDLDDGLDAERLAARIEEAMTTPFDLSGAMVSSSASVGISFAGGADELAEQVIDDADAAMYEAKRQGGGRHMIVDVRAGHRPRRSEESRRTIALGPPA